jgi:bifunctional DNA-binding transcriptional regulator/antitoxin component of YhaV-PrlF toxin-antitoxin module
MELPDELFTEHGWEVGDELDFQVSGEDGEKILVITNLSLRTGDSRLKLSTLKY